jgi:hypothetical protein
LAVLASRKSQMIHEIRQNGRNFRHASQILNYPDTSTSAKV